MDFTYSHFTIKRWKRDPSMKQNDNNNVKRIMTIVHFFAKVSRKKKFTFLSSLSYSQLIKGRVWIYFSGFSDELLRRCKQFQSQHQQKNDRRAIHGQGKSRLDNQVVYSTVCSGFFFSRFSVLLLARFLVQGMELPQKFYCF